MQALVWVDSWQQQCCGDDFRVGSSVTWRARPQEGRSEWVTLLFGRGWGERVAYHEEHHEDDETDLVEISGVVRSIREVGCRRTLQQHGSGQARVPVPGTGTMKDVQVADPWGPEMPPETNGVTFDGWIVELELAN